MSITLAEITNVRSNLRKTGSFDFLSVGFIDGRPNCILDVGVMCVSGRFHVWECFGKVPTTVIQKKYECVVCENEIKQ